MIYFKKIVIIVIIFILISSSFTVIGKNINKTINDNKNEDDCNCVKTITIKKETNTKEQQSYSLGLILEEIDPDLINSDLYLITNNPPSSWDWRNAEYKGIKGDWTTPIKDQGACGSCWAFGAIAAFESVYNLQNINPNLDIDLSEQFLVSCGQESNPFGLHGCCGGMMSATMEFLSSEGTITESCFNYQGIDSKGRDTYDCNKIFPSHDPVECSDKCSNWESHIIKIKDYNMIFGNKAIKNAISTYGPVITSMEVYDDFKYYNGGIYKRNSWNYLGGHLVSIVGYDDSQSCWICKNSWGTYWGEDGYFRIKYNECGIGGALGSAYITGYTKQARNIANNLFNNLFEFIPIIKLIFNNLIY
jgi:C1A family cysteine protease